MKLCGSPKSPISRNTCVIGVTPTLDVLAMVSKTSQPLSLVAGAALQTRRATAGKIFGSQWEEMSHASIVTKCGAGSNSTRSQNWPLNPLHPASRNVFSISYALIIIVAINYPWCQTQKLLLGLFQVTCAWWQLLR